eukprot:8017080-Ditylum_brightwellii.AAC.2
MKTKKDAYSDGANITVDTIMTSANTKYKILKQQGTWNAMLPEQEQIVALTSTVEKLKDDNLKLSQKVKTGNNFKKQDKFKGKGK